MSEKVTRRIVEHIGLNYHFNHVDVDDPQFELEGFCPAIMIVLKVHFLMQRF
jgi:hypothetical protein